MAMFALLYRYWMRTVFVLLSFSVPYFGFAADLLVKEAQLQLHMNDADTQRRVEQALTPGVVKLNAVAQELEVLNQKGILSSPSNETLELLQLCEHWQTQLRNNFSCRLGALQRDWDAAVIKNELPDRALLRQKSRQHLKLQWQANSAGVHFSDGAMAEGLQLDLQGLWQGWVLERVLVEIEKIAQQQKIILGDFSLTYGGLTKAVTTGAAFEQPVTLNGLSAFSVPLNNQTLAVFDRQHNLRKVAHYPMSRLLVTKEGWPVEFAPSLLVRANSAIEAGVLVQSLLSDSVHDALEQVNKKAGVTALAITETGMFFASKEWYRDSAVANSPWPKQLTFSIDYEIPALDVAEYRRPYIAIWIADEQGNSVRQLQVLGDNRWLRDLRVWWRKFGRADDALVDALAGATRKPGRYRIDWDGRDGQGQKVQQGKYELHLEVVREHGEREALNMPFVLNGQALSAETKGTQEIGRVRLRLQ
jgi:thiamine biosynthesis lipoprotein